MFLHLLCYWHIQENVRKHHKGTFTTEEEAEDAALTGVDLDTWDMFVAILANLCLRTFREEEFDQRWTEMKKSIAEECAEYVQNIWFDNDKEIFCTPWLTHVFHFGQRTTSRVEEAHAAIKKELGSSQKSLFVVYKSIKKVAGKHIDKCRTARSDFLQAAQLRPPPICHRVCKIYLHLFNILEGELEIAKNEFKKKEGLGAGRYQKPVCDNLYFQGRSLPCSHV